MARPKNVTKSVEKTVCLPEDLVAKVDLILWSELEGKVPFGAWQRFLIECINLKLMQGMGKNA